MEIRGARETELAEVIDLQCQVFRPDGHTRFWDYLRKDASFHPDQLRVVVVDGRIAATLRVWDRVMRFGAIPVRMGGIGGVCTHPDFRGAGYARAMMQEVIDYLRASGYVVGVLFTIIGGEFYRRLGWASVPLAGFRVTRRQASSLPPTDWHVTPFAEARDLAQVMALYAECNAQQSGSLVRPPIYWESAPARYRGVLPTMVARQGERLGGYLNFSINENEDEAFVMEVAYAASDPTALVALAHHLLQVGEGQAITTLAGDFSPRHPLVHLLLTGGAGDLELTGNSAMMLYAPDLAALLGSILPELQARLAASGRRFAPMTIEFGVNGQTVALRLDPSGTLQIVTAAAPTVRLALPGGAFWSLLLGESGWPQLALTLAVYGIRVTAEVALLLTILFPQQEVIFWGPDHF